MPDHVFDEAMRLTRLEGGEQGSTWQGGTHPAYWNMVGPFGGYTAAILMQALMTDPVRQGTPVSLSVTYAAPIREGAYTVQTRLVSATRSTQHWSVQLVQGETVAVNAIALLAQRRPVWGTRDIAMPDVPPAASLPRLELDPKRPAWVQRYAFFPQRGGFDAVARGEPTTDTRTEQWVRDEPPRPLDFAALASICDVFFPRIFLHRGSFVPAGTVALTIHFHADEAALAAVGETPVLAVAKGVNYSGGFFDQEAHIWGADGTLLAASQQMVWYKE
ncbi:thioesterase family protein [Achromobacter sp. GG226]|uniref:acyl-CoA thioesterase n=1 Tax=Verticiella alkaliphila TaxID=2779529 RepID=UPI001C0C04A9|nr:thioesterase family protein [Verticiella sp. GG226]MBU4609917.1 thioesterase family protein [Verticiella sp. GG226]